MRYPFYSEDEEAKLREKFSGLWCGIVRENNPPQPEEFEAEPKLPPLAPGGMSKSILRRVGPVGPFIRKVLSAKGIAFRAFRANFLLERFGLRGVACR